MPATSPYAKKLQKYGVNITNDNKVKQLVACIYEANILEDSVM